MSASTVHLQRPIQTPRSQPAPRSHAQTTAEATGHYRTIWLSDFHLGTHGCEAERLLAFLHAVSADQIYLVGDIIDLWRLRVQGYWPPSHAQVIARLREMGRIGTRILYLPGNHDDAMRRRIGSSFGTITVVADLIHTTANGRRYLVMHGDDLDIISRHANWLAHAGARLYAGVQRVNQVVNAAVFKGPPRRLMVSGFLKHAVKRGFSGLGRFEVRLVREARRQGVDGIICGHIHRAELRVINGITYANSGDWVESCTALVEHPDGELAILGGAQALPHAPTA